jgi:hypothetical protein
MKKNEIKLTDKIKMLTTFDETDKLMTNNLNEFKDKYKAIFNDREIEFNLLIDGIKQRDDYNILEFELFCWFDYNGSGFVLREFAKKIRKTSFIKKLNNFIELFFTEFGCTVFFSLDNKDTMFENLKKIYPAIEKLDIEEQEKIKNTCISGLDDINEFLKKLKSFDLKELENIFEDYNALLNNITVIDETPIKKLHSNSGRSKTIIFKTRKDKYKLHILAESYEFQSKVVLYIWSDLNKDWNIVKTTNPIKEHNFTFSVSDQYWGHTNFDNIIWDYIKFIEKFEE